MIKPHFDNHLYNGFRFIAMHLDQWIIEGIYLESVSKGTAKKGELADNK